MFEGFSAERVKTSGTETFLRRAGHGPAVLLLHGYPQTHAIWHRVAPALREHFTVVCADLRGYGASGRPPSDPTHAPYSKRVMARDLVEVMEGLAALGVLDVSPTLDVWSRTDQASALANFHWQLLAQREPLPERLIGADPDFFLDWLLRSWASPGFAFAPEVLTAYRAAFRDPAVIHATCEDYRAGATIDPEHEAVDRRAGRRITCPVLVLWGEGDAQSPRARFLDTSKQWADDVTGGGVACGHFISEEAPTMLLAGLGPFLERALSPAGAAP